jgi:hypothetical protein
MTWAEEDLENQFYCRIAAKYLRQLGAWEALRRAERGELWEPMLAYSVLFA